MKFPTHSVRSLIFLASITSSRGFGGLTGVAKTSCNHIRSSMAFTRSYAVTNKSPPPFTTWTFDEPCNSMDWNTLHPVELTATEVLDSSSDLILMGVFNKTLTGIAKTTDESPALAGALTKLLELKSFKGKAGMVTPILRVVADGKVSDSSFFFGKKVQLYWFFFGGLITIHLYSNVLHLRDK